jgi:hypothetical protein
MNFDIGRFGLFTDPAPRATSNARKQGIRDMSTYYSYYLRAPLKDPSISSVQEFRDIAFKAPGEICFDIESGTIHNVSSTPYFGKSTDYEGPSFSFEGMDVSNGVLSIGIFASNLERSENYYEEDGIQGPQYRSRLENLMSYLSSVTTGGPGEVQGSFGSEHDDYMHGHPIIRCADGGLRILRTDTQDDYDWYHGPGDIRTETEGVLAVIPDRIPADLVVDYKNDAYLNDIHDELVARLRPIDGSTQKLIG